MRANAMRSSLFQDTRLKMSNQRSNQLFWEKEDGKMVLRSHLTLVSILFFSSTFDERGFHTRIQINRKTI